MNIKYNYTVIRERDIDLLAREAKQKLADLIVDIGKHQPVDHQKLHALHSLLDEIATAWEEQTIDDYGVE